MTTPVGAQWGSIDLTWLADDAGIDTPTSGVLVELLLGTTWTDITQYVMTRDAQQQPITGSRGQPDESGSTDPASYTLLLNNRDGRFSPRNPLSPYYGMLVRNTQLRVSVPTQTGRSYRVWGEVSAWPQGWDSTGRDVYITITVAGLLRRLQRSNVPATSPIRRATLALSGSQVPVAYWPMEDGATATQFAAAIGSHAMGTDGGTAQPATYTDWDASDALPTLGSATITGQVDSYTTTGSTQVSWFMQLSSSSPNQEPVIRIHTTGSAATWSVRYGTGGGLAVRASDRDGTILFTSSTFAFGADDTPMVASLRLSVSGGTITWTFFTFNVDPNNVLLGQSIGGTQSGSIGRVDNIALNPNDNFTDTAVGHVTVWNTQLGLWPDEWAAQAYATEAVAGRLQRICDDAGVDFTNLVAGSGDFMGEQPRSAFGDLVSECVNLDTGLLIETTDRLGLAFLPRLAIGIDPLPHVTLDYSAGHLYGDFVPTDDDQLSANDVTVSRTEGSSARQTLDSGPMSTLDPPDGIGRYDTSTSVNAYKDARADAQAGWLLRLGTVDESRYPSVTVHLGRAEVDADLRDELLALFPGCAITVANLPAWLPNDSVDLLVLGLSETITQFEHQITFNTRSLTPWRTGVVGDDMFGRADTDGSYLAADATSSATALDVAASSLASAVWLDAADAVTGTDADFPFDISLGGERCTVTAIHGALYDEFDRATSSGWGTADSGQAWSTSGGSASDFSTSSTGTGSASILASSVNVGRFANIDTGYPDFDLTVLFSVSKLSAGDNQFVGVAGRYTDTSNYYEARLQISTGQALTLTVRSNVAGTGTTLATFTPGSWLLHTAGKAYAIRFQGAGSQLSAKLWLTATEDEPPYWQISTTDTSLSGGTRDGVRFLVGSSSTASSPTVVIDRIRDVRPQRFTVTRAVNGIVKAQTANTDVALADPTYTAL